jgi:hypothetical protein
MPQTDILIPCANCGRPVREADAEALGWRFYSDDVGELEPFCALCVWWMQAFTQGCHFDSGRSAAIERAHVGAGAASPAV